MKENKTSVLNCGHWMFSLIFILLSFKSNGQYREMIYYRVPVGAIRYFHPGDNVLYKLKSEEKFDERNGSIRLITDTLYQIDNLRFKPDNLKWISHQETRSQRLIRNLAGSLILASGLATIVYGYSVFPDNELKITDSDRYHAENVKALSYCLGGVALASISIPVYRIHPKRYLVSERWKVKYQR